MSCPCCCHGTPPQASCVCECDTGLRAYEADGVAHTSQWRGFRAGPRGFQPGRPPLTKAQYEMRQWMREHGYHVAPLTYYDKPRPVAAQRPATTAQEKLL